MIHAHDLSDRRWQALLDADAAGEPLTPSERAHLREHRAQDPAVRAEQAFYRGLAGRAAAPDEPADADDPLVAASLAAFLQAGPKALSPEPASERPASRRVWVAGAGLLLAAGLAAVWLLRPPAAAPPAPIAEAPAIPPTAPVPAPVPEALPSRPAVTVAARSGPLRAGDRDLSPGTAIAAGAALRAGDAEACLEGPDRSTLCLQPGSEAQVLEGGDLALLAGAARVAATGPTALAVVVAGVRFTADDAAYRLTVRADTWSADVERGSVSLADARGPLARLGPGDSLRRGPAVVLTAPDVLEPTTAPAAPSEPTPSEPGRTTRSTRAGKPATAMLDEARALRAAGEYARAAKAYEALIAAHPDVPSATAALVALGQLYLGRLGDPLAALRSFDRYLQRAESGALAEEAAVGRIEALRRLGRIAEERAAITLFLDRHPTSSYADGLRRRLPP